MATKSSPEDNTPTVRTEEDTVLLDLKLEPNWDAFDEDGNIRYA